MREQGNKWMNAAKGARNDEFYTQLADIEKELSHYKRHFKGKVVFVNCDDPYESAFVVYFSMNFEHLGLKALIATHYKGGRGGKPPHILWYKGDKNGNRMPDIDEFIETMIGNGDLRS